ncbi:MAG: redox-sensing transcriptional repressor Rex [Acidobacteria bacterium]|nr:redox-sensing transcriptional repressor Rex [Acidobacteriota bacterium]
MKSENKVRAGGRPAAVPDRARGKLKLAALDPAETVSELTTNRLSVYRRCLNALDQAGIRTVSSRNLAEQFHLNAPQIRKDLAYFGEFGVRGVGYYVPALRDHLRQILGVQHRVPVAIMGAGNLGLALADYPGFRTEGFEIAALFDTTREKIGHRSRGGVPIHDIRDFLNFSPGTLKVPRHVKLKSVDLTVSLESLSFFLAQGESDAE